MKNNILKDKDVRNALLEEIDSEYRNSKDTVVINELGLLQGLCRIDVAVLNGKIHGYEIKSDADTLERLPSQASMYNKVLDKLTLVVGEKHLEGALTIIPSWWGVKIFEKKKNKTYLKIFRKEKINKSIDARSVVELLWKEEVVQILSNAQINKKLLRLPKQELYELMIKNYSQRDVIDMTRIILKNRKGWRDHQQL